MVGDNVEISNMDIEPLRYWVIKYSNTKCVHTFIHFVYDPFIFTILLQSRLSLSKEMKCYIYFPTIYPGEEEWNFESKYQKFYRSDRYWFDRSDSKLFNIGIYFNNLKTSGSCLTGGAGLWTMTFISRSILTIKKLLPLQQNIFINRHLQRSDYEGKN